MVSGKLYINGAEVGEVPELLVVNTPIECDYKIGNTLERSLQLKEVKFDRLALLSLLCGRKITNNWLKMHGGIMVRNGGKKRGRR